MISLQRLEVEGLVEIARQLALGEPAAVLAQATSILRMQDAIRGAGGQIAMFQELDEAFHEVLYRGVGQGNIYLMIRARSGHLNRLRRLEPPDADKIEYICRGHHAILDAIWSRDPGAAAKAVRDHLSRTVRKVEAQRERYRSYFTQARSGGRDQDLV